MRITKVLGWIIIIFGLILNEFTIRILSDFETKFAAVDKSLALVLFQLFIILVGVYILIKGKVALQNLLVLTASILFFFILFELTLAIFFQADTDNNHPIWIPLNYKELDWNINQQHVLMADSNQYGFNDINHTFYKAKNIDYRIAILGDSFIWGDGVEDSVRWSNKLQKLFVSSNCNVEIFNWGRRGWSTLDQFHFLKQDGIKYEFDLLIFAFVVNDPVMDSTDANIFIRSNGFVGRNFQRLVGIIFPNSVSFITDLINNFFENNFGYGYSNWLKKIYTNSNLHKYSKLLFDIKKYCSSNGIKFVFILTPENHNKLLKEHFDKIIPILIENDIKYFNLFPMISEELKEYPLRKLWANPANGHPGDLVTSVIANYSYKVLVRSYSFDNCQRTDSTYNIISQ